MNPTLLRNTLWGEFDGLASFDAAALQSGRFSVRIDGGRFEALFQQQPGDHLWVLLSAARDPARSKLPTFNRWSWAPRFPGPVLCVSDPTLYLDEAKMRIGWYVGTEAADWQGALADLVRSVARRLSLPTRKVICYGSSAGGFASLMLAGRLGDATAVAINPQSDVLQYSPVAVRRLLQLAFGGRAPEALTDDERTRLSAIRLYERTPRVRCHYVQNRLDRGHMRKHFAPFADRFWIPQDGGEDPSGHFHAVVYDDPRGHAPEPREMIPGIIERAVQLADAELPPRGAGGPALSLASGPLGEPVPTLQQLGLSALAARVRDPVGTGPRGPMDHGWRALDDALAGAADGSREIAPEVLHEVDAWIDAALAGQLARRAWSAPLVGMRATRLAWLIAVQRSRPGPWSDARWASVETVFRMHLTALLERIDASDAAPAELHALAALRPHLGSDAQRRWLGTRLRVAVDAALDRSITANGLHKAQAPGVQHQAQRSWQRLADSGWFAGTRLEEVLARSRRALAVLRLPDGRMLPLGDTGGASAPAAQARLPRWDEPAPMVFGGHVLHHDAPGRRLLHLLAANRTSESNHDDGLAVIWFDGEEILTDPGAAPAEPGALAAHLAGARAHTTVAIASPPADPTARRSNRLLQAEAVDGRLLLTARKTDVRWHAQVVRHLVHAPGEWLLLVDELVSTAEWDWVQALQFGPGVRAEDDSGARWRLGDGRLLTLHATASARLDRCIAVGQVDPPQGWLVRDGVAVAAPAVEHRLRCNKGVVATLLVLGDAQASLERVRDDAVEVRLRRDGQAQRLEVAWTRTACEVRPPSGTR